MLTIVIMFLWAFILRYVLPGGADFGAGILEMLSPRFERRITRKLIYESTGPIWQANQVWLVIAVVILFVGFPDVYETISTSFYIPLLILLLGITARIATVSFRSNDGTKDDFPRVYSRIFAAANTIAPFFFGIVAGTITAGNINLDATGFIQKPFYSWLHWFPLAVGLFTVPVCTWLAAIYMILLKNGMTISLFGAPDRQSIAVLGRFFLVGSLLTLPVLFYLKNIFDGGKKAAL
jgi:cytochrome bd ubiquinol oxidase subunit II